MTPLPAPFYAHGFSLRKQPLLRQFTSRDDIRFIGGKDVARIQPGSSLLLWGSAPVPEGLREGVRIVRVEDGFIRSIGLGADLVRPVSWVLDDVGMYYDATRPSGLERILQERVFDAGELVRAASLRARLVAAGITKYNLAAPPWKRPEGRRHVVLVPGQVESDASIALGSPVLRTNLEFLRRVREARPDAWIVYKPHPDVAAGLRGSGSDAGNAGLADETVAEGAMHQMLEAVDEVHVLTSLAGFEALLRGKPVTCWGQPFYSGFGLTSDMVPSARRTRTLALDELVAGALLCYPTYVHRFGGGRCNAETALDELLAWRCATSGRPPLWRKLLRPLLARP